MSGPIEFYFDFASPYGYFASTQIEDVAKRHGRPVAWRPMLLGAALKVTGGSPLTQIPLKADYAVRDMPRFARFLGVPFRMPVPMPMNSLAAARAFYWFEGQDAERARAFAKAAYHAHFGEGNDLTAPEAVAAVGAKLGVEAEAVLAGMQEPAVKDRLRTVTEEALGRGVFGSPYIFVDGEPFWGADRLDQVERWLETGGY